MPSPFSPADLDAIAVYFQYRNATRCPPTGRGALPIGFRAVIAKEHQRAVEQRKAA